MSIRFIYDRKKTAVTYGEDKYSYKDVINYVKFFSSLLNIEKGERVVTLLENRPATIFALFSVWDKQGISVNLDAASSEEQLSYVFGDSKPSYIFVSNKTKTTVEKALENTGYEMKIINVDEIKIPENFIPKSEVLDVENEEDVAVILYTSGTTGDPKGVMLTYENIIANINGVKNVNLVDDTDTILAMLPYHHILPLSFTLIMPLYFGVPIVILDQISSENLKRTLKEHKISVVIGVPRVWEMLDKAIMAQINKSKIAKFMFNLAEKVKSTGFRKFLFSKVHKNLGGNIRVLVSGGAKLDEEVLDHFLTMGFHLIQGYGMTETAPIIAFNVPGRERKDTVGEVIPDVFVKIAEDGEILVKGKNVMKGYYNNPEATKKTFNEDGWLCTGDLGKMDEGHLVIVGRKKEMIVLPNGKNINPGDIEAEIFKGTDLIKEIAVVDYEDHLLALIHPDLDLIAERKIVNTVEAIKWEVIDKYNITAPNYKKIHEIKIIKDELPKTRMGKIRRFMLKDLIEDNTTKENSENKSEEKKVYEIPEEIKENYEKLREYIEETYKEEINPESHIELDLGFDSLDIVELSNFIVAKFNVDFTEEDFIENKTIASILELVKKKQEENSGNNKNLKKLIENQADIKLPKSALMIKITKFIFAPIFKLYFNLKIKGRENIEDGAGIIVGNHQSFIDAFMVNSAFSNKEVENNYYIATALHFKSGLKKWAADNGNIILVDVNKNLKGTLQAASKVLKENKKLIIFPEGARTRDGELQEFKKTFAILAKELNVPIYPFVLKGAYESMPYGVKFPRKKNLSIEFIKKIEPTDKAVEEIVEETKNSIEKTYKN
ncbi:MAG: AMP-binding protein [Fusobacterium sp.]|nr:AMP-binding protein [Fusobacterium sp.]